MSLFTTQHRNLHQLSIPQRYRYLRLLSSPLLTTLIQQTIEETPHQFLYGTNSTEALQYISSLTTSLISSSQYPSEQTPVPVDSFVVFVHQPNSNDFHLDPHTILSFIIPHFIAGYNILFATIGNEQSPYLDGILSIFTTINQYLQQQQVQTQNYPKQYQLSPITLPISQLFHSSIDTTTFLKQYQTQIMNIFSIGPKSLSIHIRSTFPLTPFTASHYGPSTAVFFQDLPSIDDITSRFATHLLSSLPSTTNIPDPLSTISITYIHASIIDDFRTKLVHAIMAQSKEFTTKSLSSQQLTTIQSNQHIAIQNYSVLDKDIITFDNGINLIPTVHWSSIDLDHITSPTLLIIPFRNNTELLNFLSTTVNTHICSLFGTNISQLLEIGHHNRTTANTILFNSFPTTTTTTTTSTYFSTQFKETGCGNPFQIINQRFNQTHQQLMRLPITDHNNNNNNIESNNQLLSVRSFPLLPSSSSSTTTISSSSSSITTATTTTISINNIIQNKTTTSIDKTIKQYIGGKQSRSEGEYSFVVPITVNNNDNEQNINSSIILPSATRKDVRDAVESAFNSHELWEKTNGSLKLQMLLYLAENIQLRYQYTLPIEFLQKITEIIFKCAHYSDKFGGFIHSVQSHQDNIDTTSLKLYIEPNNNNHNNTNNEDKNEPTTINPNSIDILNQFHYILHKPHGVVFLLLSTHTKFCQFITMLVSLIARGNSVVVIFHINTNNTNANNMSSIALMTDFYQVLETTGLTNIHILFTHQPFGEAVLTALKHKNIAHICAHVNTTSQIEQIQNFAMQTSKDIQFFTDEMFSNENLSQLITNAIRNSSIPKNIIFSKE